MKKITFLFVTMFITLNLFAGAVTVVIPNGSGQAEINTAMTDAVAASNTDITLQFEDGGVYGALDAPINNITVPAGVTKLTLTALSTVSVKPILYLDQIIYSDALMANGITLDNLQFITAVADNKYLIQNSSANMPGKIIIKNSYLKGYRAVVLVNTVVNNISEIVLYNNVFNAIGGYGILNISSSAITISKVTIRNNTWDCGERTTSDYLFSYRTTLANLTTFNFSKNIVYYLGNLGRGFIRFNDSNFDANNQYTVNGNLFVPKTTATELRMGYSTTYLNIKTDGDSTNYYSSNYVSPTRISSMIFTIYNESSPSILFVSPTNGNFFINDPSYPGSTNIGASWNKLLTSVSSTKTPSFTAYPNPTTDVVYFNKNYAQIEVINLIGKTLQFDNNTNICSLKNLAKGTYLIRTTDETGNQITQKISKF